MVTFGNRSICFGLILLPGIIWLSHPLPQRCSIYCLCCWYWVVVAAVVDVAAAVDVDAAAVDVDAAVVDV